MTCFNEKYPELDLQLVVIRCGEDGFTIFEACLQAEELIIFNPIENCFDGGFDYEILEDIKDELFWMKKNDLLERVITIGIYNCLYKD